MILAVIQRVLSPLIRISRSITMNPHTRRDIILRIPNFVIDKANEIGHLLSPETKDMLLTFDRHVFFI